MNKTFLHNLIGNTLVVVGILTRVNALKVYADKGFSITPEQFTVLRLLVEEGDMYQRQIGEILYKDRPNMTRILNILEEQQLVTRTDVLGKKMISATMAGQEMYKMILPVSISERKTLIQGIDENDLKTCINVLEQMKKNLGSKVKMQV